MKYIKKFNETNEYDSFKNSDAYILPNVSFVVNANTVMFAPAAKQLSVVYIDEIPYEFEEGMTWGDWINAQDWFDEYENFRDDGGYVWCYWTDGWVGCIGHLYAGGTQVKTTDLINKDLAYKRIFD